MSNTSATTALLRCSLENSVGPAQLWIVEDFDTTASDFEIWGEIDDPFLGLSNFCCVVPAVTSSSRVIDVIAVFGSLYTDDIHLAYQNGMTLNHLQPSAASTTIAAYVNSGDDIDDINGSGYDASDYDEYLCGAGESDHINGHPGDDFIYGDDCDQGVFPLSATSDTDSGQADGADDLVGDYGVDHVYGHCENDDISGGAGTDYLYGNDQDDVIRGNEGDDFIYGGGGEDRLGGGADADTIDGGPSDDVICGNGGPDILSDSSSTDVDAFWGPDPSGIDTVTCDAVMGMDTVDQYSSSSITCNISFVAPACP